MTDVSPRYGYRLDILDGDPDGIERAGREYTRIGERMDWTATELDNLSADRRYKAEGLDAIREDAGNLGTDLAKIAQRYTGSGPVLVTYADALRTARNRTVDPLVDDIRDAVEAHRNAVNAREDAEGQADDLQNPWPWQEPATDAQLARAAEEASDARSAEGARQAALDDLWESFESGYSVWEQAYEQAVRDLENVYTTSGIDDNPWEDAFDGIANFLTYAGMVLVVIAIFATGPLAVIVLIATTVVAIATLAIHVGMMLAGSNRVTMGDLVFDLIGIVPFGGALLKSAGTGTKLTTRIFQAAGGSPAASGVIGLGRNAVEDGLRTIAGAGGVAGGQAARTGRASQLADDFLQSTVGNWGQNAWNVIRSGGARFDGQVLALSERITSAWPTSGVPRIAAINWIEDVGAAGRFLQGVNVVNAANAMEQSLALGLGHFGVELPTVSDIPGLDFNPLAR